MVRRARKVRSGLGIGSGKGYKNLIPTDPKIHSQSAKGIKQPQRVKDMPKRKNKFENLNDAELEAIQYMDEKDFLALKKYFDDEYSPMNDFDEETDGVYRIETEDREEFLLFKDDDKAEQYATEYVADMLEAEPETFSRDFLMQHLYITDTDKRMIAQEESDNIIDEQLDSSEIIEQAGSDFEERIEKVEEKRDIIRDKQIDAHNEGKLAPELEEEDSKVEQEMDEIIEEAKEKLRGEKYDEIYEKLDRDAYDYFVNEQGIYTPEEFFKASFVRIDIENASKEAVSIDGWGHFLASYDGEEQSIPDSDYVLARRN